MSATLGELKTLVGDAINDVAQKGSPMSHLSYHRFCEDFHDTLALEIGAKIFSLRINLESRHFQRIRLQQNWLKEISNLNKSF